MIISIPWSYYDENSGRYSTCVSLYGEPEILKETTLYGHFKHNLMCLVYLWIEVQTMYLQSNVNEEENHS